MSQHKPIIGIVGAGKVGQVLARSWVQYGYDISVVYSRTREHADQLAKTVSAQVVASATEVLEGCDLVVLCVPDDVIGQVGEAIADNLHCDEYSGKAVVHVSGSRSADVLIPLLRFNVMVGSFHPAFPFSDVDSSIENIRGTTFAIEATDPILKQWLNDLADSLDGRSIYIPEGEKELYHLALVLVSNYTVTLYSVAEQLLMHLGAERDVADGTLTSLLSATVENIKQIGIPNALTGPLVRSDAGTLDAHLKVLIGANPALKSVYIGLARLSYPMLEARGIDIEQIEEILRQDEREKDAVDNT